MHSCILFLLIFLIFLLAALRSVFCSGSSDGENDSWSTTWNLEVMVCSLVEVDVNFLLEGFKWLVFEIAVYWELL